MSSSSSSSEINDDNDPTTTGTTTTASMGDALTFLTEICGILKRIKRTGWIRNQIPFPESDADHMHRCAMCALLLTQPPHPHDDYTSSSSFKEFHPKNVNTMKLLKMTLTHDLCESLAGDITPHCSKQLQQSKYSKEHEAMKYIHKIIGDPLGLELYTLWKEYEDQISIEAKYAKDIDKFEMILQAYEYEQLHLQYNNQNKQHHNKPPNNNNNKQTTTIKEEEEDGISEGTSTNHHHDNKEESAATAEEGEDEGGEKESSSLLVLKEPLRDFFISTRTKIRSPLFRRLDRELRQKRHALLKSRGWIVMKEEEQASL